jgi:HAD superfamily hydrolase (TIGR01450 family)
VNFDALICDLDGVIWRGDRPVPGAAAAITELQRRSVRFAFVTNNSFSGPRHYQERLRRMGIEAEERTVITVGRATAQTVRRVEGIPCRALVIGTAALRSELETVGVEIIEPSAVESSDVVVVGGHPAFHYRELQAATRALARGASFYATGRDRTYPVADGVAPATGAIVAAIEWAANRQARVIGKPHAPLFREALAELGPAQHVAVVGDNLDSDIAGAERLGLASILVLTGSTAAEQLSQRRRAPGRVIHDLAELCES